MRTPRFARTSAALVAASLVVGMAACSSSGGSSAATVPSDVNLEVDAGPGIKFASTEYSTAAGDAVKIALVNRDSQKHTMVVVDSTGKTLPGELEVGKSGDIDTGTYKLAAGTYQLLCLVPGHNNMKATLTVS